ncbi:MAG TPA: hypothetical protein VF762_14165 [Blastocatellia bacterium]|jgi:hypothetical protein
MGIEQRRSGKLYYYKKKRVGGKVVSEYQGGGELVHILQHIEAKDRAEKEAERERLRAERISMAEIDKQIDDFSRMVDMLMEAELISKGFHQHKRQWRKRRNGS